MNVICVAAFAFLLLSFCPIALAESSSCSLNYVSAEYSQKQSSIVFWSYSNSELGDKMLAYKTEHHISQIRSSVDESFQPLIVWIERSGKDDRLFSTSLDLKGDWAEPLLIEKSKSELSSPSLIRAPDGTSYLAWASDESGNDDVYLAQFSENKWSSPKTVNQKNSVPDILPTLSVERDGSVGLAWRTFTKPSIGYEDRFNEVTQALSAVEKKQLQSWQCDYEKSEIALPETTESLFINYYQDVFDSTETRLY
jgi:hypothetical protein